MRKKLRRISSFKSTATKPFLPRSFPPLFHDIAKAAAAAASAASAAAASAASAAAAAAAG